MPWPAGARGENLRKQQEYHSLPAAAGVEQLTEASLRNDPGRLGRIEGTHQPISIVDTSNPLPVPAPIPYFYYIYFGFDSGPLNAGAPKNLPRS